MRTFSNAVMTLLAQDTVSIFYIIDIATDTPIKHTTYYRDLTCAFGTYSADNSLIGVDAPKLASNLDREAYKILYTDPLFDFRAVIEAGVMGRAVAVRVGFVNNSGSTLDGIPNGFPLTGTNDFITAYSGAIEYALSSTSNEENTVTFECSAPMATLNFVNSHFTSQDYLRHRLPGDNSFDQVYEGSKGVTLLWGKK